MTDDLISKMAHLDSSDAKTAKISDSDRRAVTVHVGFTSFFLFSCCGYAGVNGDLQGCLAFGALSLLGIFCIIIVNIFSSPPSRRHLRRATAHSCMNLALCISGPARAWQAEDWRATIEVACHPTRYSVGLIHAAVRMRLYDLGGLLVKSTHWALASNHRTWWPLGSLLTLAAVNIHLSQGWGSALWTLPAIVGFHAAVEWLRHRWGIELKPKPSAGDPGRDQ